MVEICEVVAVGADVTTAERVNRSASSCNRLSSVLYRDCMNAGCEVPGGMESRATRFARKESPRVAGDSSEIDAAKTWQ